MIKIFIGLFVVILFFTIPHYLRFHTGLTFKIDNITQSRDRHYKIIEENIYFTNNFNNSANNTATE